MKYSAATHRGNMGGRRVCSGFSLSETAEINMFKITDNDIRNTTSFYLSKDITYTSLFVVTVCYMISNRNLLHQSTDYSLYT